MPAIDIPCANLRRILLNEGGMHTQPQAVHLRAALHGLKAVHISARTAQHTAAPRIIAVVADFRRVIIEIGFTDNQMQPVNTVTGMAALQPLLIIALLGELTAAPVADLMAANGDGVLEKVGGINPQQHGENAVTAMYGLQAVGI